MDETVSKEVTLRLYHTDAPVRVARHFAREHCRAWGVGEDGYETVALVVSELVTNAAVHARGTDGMRLSLAGEDTPSPSVRVEVDDDDERSPVLGVAVPGADGGRGMTVVSRVCESWGTRQTDTGKTVWAVLPVVMDSDLPSVSGTAA